MGRDLDCIADVLMGMMAVPIRTSASMRFLGFSNHNKRSKPPAPLSSWSLRQTVCSTFSRSGWSVVRSAPLATGGTSKSRPSPHLHKVPTRSNKVRPRTLQTALVHTHTHTYTYTHTHTHTHLPSRACFTRKPMESTCDSRQKVPTSNLGPEHGEALLLPV
jgi:hypothetical protein